MALNITEIKNNLFKRKNSGDIANSAQKSELKKSLRLFDLVVFGVGAIFGSGIFTIVGVAAAGANGNPGAGPALVLSMIIAVIACILSALCYCEFATMIPSAGSAYIYAYATMGEFIAWIVGWLLILEYIIGTIAVSIAWSGYLMQLLKGFEAILPAWVTNPPVWIISDFYTLSQKGSEAISQVPHLFGTIPFSINLPAILIVLTVAFFITRGTKQSSIITAIMVGIKIVIALLFIFTGIFYVNPQNWTPFAPNGIEGIFSGAFIIFFAYIGFDSIATVSEECKSPKKDLPLGIILSLCVCTLIYVLIAVVLTGIMPLDKIDLNAPVAYALRYIGQTKIAGLISFGALAAMTSVMLVMTIAGTRILYAMSRDNFLPPVFKTLSKRSNTPNILTWFIAGIIIVGIITTNLSVAADLCNLGTFASFVIVCSAIIILRKLQPDTPRPFKVPFFPLVPILGILICSGLMLISLKNGGMSSYLFLIYMIVGVAFYFAYGYKKIRQEEKNLK